MAFLNDHSFKELSFNEKEKKPAKIMVIERICTQEKKGWSRSALKENETDLNHCYFYKREGLKIF